MQDNAIPPRRAALYALARQIYEQAQMSAYERRVQRAIRELREDLAEARKRLRERHGRIVAEEAEREVWRGIEIQERF